MNNNRVINCGMVPATANKHRIINSKIYYNIEGSSSDYYQCQHRRNTYTTDSTGIEKENKDEVEDTASVPESIKR